MYNNVIDEIVSPANTVCQVKCLPTVKLKAITEMTLFHHYGTYNAE